MTEKTTLHGVCLRAARCSLCEGYVSMLEGVLPELTLPGVNFREHWIDIEDAAELVGDVDVATFPKVSAVW